MTVEQGPSGDNSGVILRTLDILSARSLESWTPEQQYREEVGDSQFLVNGFRTTLDLDHRHFAVWLEELTAVSPDSMRDSRTVPYRIRIANNEAGKRVDIGGFEFASVEDVRVRYLYRELTYMAEARVEAEEEAARQLLVDFHGAIRAQE